VSQMESRQSKPESTDSMFVAKIHSLDIANVKRMREDLYQAHRYEDPQIIAHWAKVHALIEENKLFMVRPAKAIAAKIVDLGQPQVDNGDVPSLGHFIANLCKKALLKPEKKEGGIWG